MQSPYVLANDWRVLPLSIADQQHHIEQSELLLERAAESPPVLYWSMAERPGIVLGFSQKREMLNARALERWRLPVYQRRAGGTAVLVGPHLLGLDVVLPPGHPFVLADVVESYRWLGETWVATLAQFGVQARAVSPEEAHEQGVLLKRAETCEREALLRRACYGALSPYEVVVGTRKVVGLDMRRRRVGSLLQAGMLLHWETDVLAQVLGHTPAEEAALREGLLERAVGLDELVGRVLEAKEVIEAFEEIIQGEVDNEHS